MCTTAMWGRCHANNDSSSRSREPTWYTSYVCVVGKTVMQDDSQAAMLWHLWQFEAHVLTSVTLMRYDIFIQAILTMVT